MVGRFHRLHFHRHADDRRVRRNAAGLPLYQSIHFSSFLSNILVEVNFVLVFYAWEMNKISETAHQACQDHDVKILDVVMVPVFIEGFFFFF